MPNRYRVLIALLSLLCIQRSLAATGLSDGCQTKKGCIFYPEGCDPSAPNCLRGLTYKKNGDFIDFELLAKLPSPNNPSGQYAAVGFSEDLRMGNDAVTSCNYNPSTGKVTVALSYNPRQSNEPIADRSWVDSQIHDVSGSVINGTLICRFSQKIQPPSAAGANLKIFPLEQDYYPLFATGPLKGEGLGIHSTNDNDQFFPAPLSQTKVSFDTLDFPAARAGGDSNGQAAAPPPRAGFPTWKRALVWSHGILMIFGWWLLVACAILFARYFKSMLPGRQCCGLDSWFHFHRGLNFVGVAAIIAAFVCILVVLVVVCTGWGFSYSDWYPRTTHAILGLTAFIGALLQPVLALFRCDKFSAKRPIFNWVHRIIGLGSWGCASAAIWLTTEFYGSLQNDGHYGIAPRALMIFYWAALGFVIIGLEIWITISERMKSRAAVAGDIQMRTINGKHIETTVTPAENKYGIIRCLLMVFFVLVAIGVTVALACFIALPQGA